MKYAFIQHNKLAWPICVQCRVLLVSVSGYHEHLARRVDFAQRRHLSDEALLVHISAVYAENRGAYGWPRIWRQLRAQGIRVGKQRVQRLMQKHGIQARGKRKFRVTTTAVSYTHLAEQGSQQLQGEAQELELESLLRTKFMRDTIDPVPKGEFGGDVLHRVIGPLGQHCGTILWESKRTKNWSDGWLPKLRDDQRAAKAEIALLVSQVLPKGVEALSLIHI